MNAHALTALTELRLYGNAITDIGPLSGLTGLVSLSLSDNSITDLTALTGLTELNALYLDGNRDLSDIQPLLDNPGFGPRRRNTAPVNTDFVDLRSTSVTCEDVAALEAQEAIVRSDCP